VPYVAFGPNTLGKANLSRLGEVLRDRLCQVCGLPIDWPALVVLRTDDPTSWPNGHLLDGPVHLRECGRLAFANCPFLKRRTGIELLKVEAVDVEMIRGRPWTVRKERHAALCFPFDQL